MRGSCTGRRVVVLVCVSLFLAASCSTAPQRKDSSPIAWRSLEAGRAEASATGKPLLIDFYFGQGCKRCAELEQNVYSDPDVRNKVERHFVPVKVDLTRQLTPDEAKVAEQFKSGGECMLLFLDSRGMPFEDRHGVNLCFMGMVHKDQFMGYLDDVIAATRNR